MRTTLRRKISLTYKKAPVVANVTELPVAKDLDPFRMYSGWVTKPHSKKRRYLVLTKQQILYIFNNPNEGAKKQIPLSSCKEFTTCHKDVKTCSLLYETDHSLAYYFFIPDTDEERILWISYISTLLSQLVDQKVMEEYVRREQLSLRRNLRDQVISQRLRVKVMEAKGLQALKTSPHSNIESSVILSNGSTLFHSFPYRCKSNENPTWADQEFLFDINEEDHILKLFVIDELQLQKEAVGKLEIRIGDIKNQGEETLQWYYLSKPDKELVTGDIRLKLNINPSTQNLHVTLVEGRNLAAKDINGLSDPFVRFYYGKQKKKSKIMKCTLNPMFDEEMIFKKESNDVPLKLVVWDKDRLTNDYMGEYTLDMKDFGAHSDKDIWLPLYSSNQERRAGNIEDCSNSVDNVPQSQDDNTNFGEVRLAIKFIERVILPAAAYASLKKLLISDMHITTYYANVIPERQEIAKAYVNFYEIHSLTIPFFLRYTRDEVAASKEATLFREASLFSKAIEYLLRLVGTSFLQKTLATFVSNVIKNFSKHGIDIDHTQSNYDAKSIKKIEELTSSVLDIISDSVKSFPLILKGVLEGIRLEVESKYKNEIVTFNSISAFLFLRYFTAAINSPQLYDIALQMPNQRASTVLRIVAKIILNLSNFSKFEKEAHMLPFNDYLLQNYDRMKSIILSYSTTDGKLDLISNSGVSTLWEENELAEIHFFFTKYYTKMIQHYPNFPNHGLLKSILIDLNTQTHYSFTENFVNSNNNNNNNENENSYQ